MPHTVTLADAKSHLEDLVERARQGEESVITNASGQPVAKVTSLPGVETGLVTAPEETHEKLFGLMPEIQLLPGWDDPLEEFEEYS